MQEHFGALSFKTLKAEIGKWGKITQTSKLANKLGVYWNRKDILLMMGTEIFKIDASWAEKLTKTRVQFLLTPTVYKR